MPHIRALSEFLSLSGDDAPTTAEQTLIEACRSGTPCSLGPAAPEAGSDECSIRAELLRYLILGGCDACRVDPAGVHLQGAFVVGRLDFSYADVPAPIQLLSCRFTSAIGAQGTKLKSLALTGSKCAGLIASNCQTQGDILLDRDFHSTARVQLSHSIISGKLDCTGGWFEDAGTTTESENRPRVVLSADGSVISDDFLLNDGFHATGVVQFQNARIGGSLLCRNARLEGFNSVAMAGAYSEVILDVEMGQTKTGEHNTFSSSGPLVLQGIKIGGNLIFRGGRFLGPGAQASDTTSPPDLAESHVRPDAAILDFADIAGGVWMESDFEAEGGVSLFGCTIGGNFEATGVRLTNPGKDALTLANAHIQGSAILGPHFHAVGEVSFAGATIGGSLRIGEDSSPSESRLSRGPTDADKKKAAFEGYLMKVAGPLSWRHVTVENGHVSFASAEIGELHEILDANTGKLTWPAGANKLYLNGMTYRRLSAVTAAGTPRPGITIDTSARLEWVRSGSIWYNEFYPQPYSQLAKVLREAGHDNGSRDVLVAQAEQVQLFSMERAKSLAKTERHIWRFLALCGLLGRHILVWLQHWLVGYGYKPVQSLWGLAILVVTAVYMAHATWIHGGFVPTGAGDSFPKWLETHGAERNPAASWSAATGTGKDYETFNAAAWGFELVVPLVAFGQTRAWAPSSTRGSWAWWLWWMRWPLAVLGWIVAGFAAAAVTGVIRRE